MEAEKTIVKRKAKVWEKQRSCGRGRQRGRREFMQVQIIQMGGRETAELRAKTYMKKRENERGQGRC